MKNTNISQLGCSTLGEQIEKNRKLAREDKAWNFVIAFVVFIGILLIISFLTIPR